MLKDIQFFIRTGVADSALKAGSFDRLEVIS